MKTEKVQSDVCLIWTEESKLGYGNSFVLLFSLGHSVLDVDAEILARGTPGFSGKVTFFLSEKDVKQAL